MRKILVIDDEPMIRATIGRVLRFAGFDLVLAEDGIRGVAAFRTEKPDLVITDIIMPVQDGIATIAEIMREFPGSKVIAMSGGGRIDNEDVLELARQAGARDTIRKPFLPRDLIDCVNSCLSAA